MNQEKKDKSFNRKMGERYKKASTEEKKQGCLAGLQRRHLKLPGRLS